jgi:transcriptional regulator with XRE-family HTH domain
MTEQELKTIFGTNIRTRREQKKWSQEELSVKTGVTKNTISDIETGQKFARAKTYAKLAEVFDTEPYELLKPKGMIPDKVDDVIAHFNMYVRDALEEAGHEYIKNLKD